MEASFPLVRNFLMEFFITGIYLFIKFTSLFSALTRATKAANKLYHLGNIGHVFR